jgi:hypothetical protein
MKLDMFENLEDSSFHKNHKDIKTNKSYMWHFKESIPRTEVFGRLAVRVCSKILGIGSAERAWGDVKHLKSNKRSHLSADRVKKQATLFGRSSMQMAKLKMEDTTVDLHLVKDNWLDDDLEVVMELFDDKRSDVDSQTQPSRVFNAWLEELDIERIGMRDDPSMFSLLHKFGGLNWREGETVYRSSSQKMMWHKRGSDRNNNICGGWFLIAYDDTLYDSDLTFEENRDSGGIEEFPIDIDLIHSIADYYKAHPTRGITVKFPELESQCNSDKEEGADTEYLSNDDDDDDDGVVIIPTNFKITEATSDE